MGKFFEFNQNNTGGYFITNDKVCGRVFIEADNATDAARKAEDIGCYWDGVDDERDCPCCGDRWGYPDDDQGVSYPMKYGGVVYNSVEEYAQYLANDWGWTSPDARIFYADGTVKEIFRENNNG
jgi:hypothetical protein